MNHNLSFEEIYEKRKIAQKNFKKKYKKLKKDLIRSAKEFHPSDFFYLLEIIFKSLDIMYLFYKDPDLLYCDTSNPINNYEEWFKPLEECHKLISVIADNCIVDRRTDDKIRRIFNLVKDNYSNWWD